MDTSEAESELSELETRIERLRALYEQYFLGLEKLEPLIARKDVDRRIWVLRREQLRNTGLRFKFQMLIQRYNSFQQYWGRILREIENGTYRRDVVRAAKRFGAKEALTILGRRRAQKYEALAIAQQARREGWSKDAQVEELPDEYLEEEPLEEHLVEDEYLGDDDLEPVSDLDDDDDDDDEAPTLSFRRDHHAALAAHIAAAQRDRQIGAGSARAPVARPSSPAPEVVAPAARPSSPAAEIAAPVARPASPAAEPAAPAVRPPSPAAPAAKSPPAKMEPIAPLPRSSDPDAAKRRVAELAAQGRPSRSQSSGAHDEAGPLELDLDFDGPRTSKKTTKPPPRRTSSAKMGAVKSSATPASGVASQKPGSGRKQSNRNLRMRAFIAPTHPRARPSAPTTEESPPPPQLRDAMLPPPPPPPEPSAAAPGPARAQERPRPQPAARGGAAAPPEPDAGLEEKRLRQIYAKYIATKRSVNEPTAGITFEKLAESLRAQAAKLRESHAANSVDYDVIVKNGKTLLKPILK
jgi:hypothetical protein